MIEFYNSNELYILRACLLNPSEQASQWIRLGLCGGGRPEKNVADAIVLQVFDRRHSELGQHLAALGELVIFDFEQYW